MKQFKIIFAIVFITLILIGNVFGQTASSTWPLTSVTTVSPTNSGSVTGNNESFSNMVINNYAGPNSSQRVTTTTGSWPAETAQNETRYIQFAVSPNPTYSFNITSVTLSLGASGGGNMKVNIWCSVDPTFTVRTQLNSSVLSLPDGSLSSLSYSPTVNVNDGQTFYLRIYPWYTSSASGKYVCPQNVVISGTTSSATPLITTSVSSLTNFSQTVGTPSATQTYTVSGNNLSNDVVVTVPTGFEISTNSGSTWNNNSSPVTLTQSGGMLTGQPITISVRMNASSAAVYSGNITHTSIGATTKNIAVSGTALATEPTVQSSITFGTVTDVSIVADFAGGNGARRILVARSGSGVNWEPVDGNAITGVNSNFASATDQGNGNKVVYDGTGTTVTMTGLTQNTTYHVAVYEYNVGTGNTQNYLITLPGIGNQTTLAVATISVTPTSLSFGNVLFDSTSVEKTYIVSGTTLTPSSGNITASAPTGYEVSATSGSGYASSVQIPYTSGALSATALYARFKPTAIQSYTGNISNSGGGATIKNVSVSGFGVAPPAPNEFQAEDAILVSSYIRTQYPGYTGTGYVDMADKTGSSVEFVIGRTTAATDTVTIFFANGGSSRSLTVSLNDVNIATPSFPGTGSWSNWSTLKVVVALHSGLNRLRFTLNTNGSGPNLDKIVVGGQQATAMFRLTLTKSGSGTVSANPQSTYYEAGTSVTLTATPNSGHVFYRWGGTDESQSNPFALIMNSHKTIIGVMTPSAGFGSFPYESSPKGFASVGAFGYPNGTTGGTGADQRIEYVTNSTDLMNIMFRRVDPNRTLNFPPLTVYVIGTLTAEAGVAPMLDVKDLYDVSIIGVGTDATITGFGFLIVRSKNVIVRNIKFMNSPDDGINIQGDDVEGTGNHIWIDHCTFTNCYDGALDVTHTASYVTLSWNYFYKHDKACLQGHSDSQTSDVAMKITWHHNYFDSTGQRHPRVRFGKSHVFNNYYRKCSLYGVSSNLEADVVVEGSYFLDVPIPFETSRDASPPGDLVARNNILAGTTGGGSTRGTAFEPSTFYTYAVDLAADIPAMLTAYAGSGKYDFSGGYPTTPTTTFSLAINAIHGTVTRNPSQAVYDSGSTVHLTAVPATGYHFVNWSGDLSGSDNPSSIIMNSNKNVTANFSINQYTITATAGPNGSINPSGVLNLNYGDSLRFTITPATGYRIDSVLVDGVNQGTMSSYLFLNVVANQTINVKFAIQQFTITSTAGANGSISPSGVINVNYGDSLLFTITPTAGYRIDSVKVNSIYQGPLSSYTFRNISANHSITVNFAVASYSSSFFVDPGWNMVSVPLTVIDYRKSELFPNSISSAFIYANGYLVKDTLKNCSGYWLKFLSAEEISISGTQRASDSVEVNTGWNMIGSISLPIRTSDISPSSGISIRSPFYGYQNGYFLTDSIKSGSAYWVKVSGSGKLYFNSGSGLSKENAIHLNELEMLNKINITDAAGSSQTLYFGVDADAPFPIDYFGLPPSPPKGVFDVRYSSQRAVELHKSIIEKPEIFPITISSAVFPITISWDVQKRNNDVYELSAGDNVIELTGIGSKEYIVENIKSISLKARNKEIVPAEFILSQNYPNPFNPSTQIKFSADKTARTKLEIFNLLGQKVLTLFDEVAEAGRYYTVQFDAKNLTTGVYYYKLQNEQKSQIKKLLLLK
ncbi:MAG: T9SS type A sorting domain-containing protein [Bacteroidota bacterium]|nr:T9SS type A sorting domain-containing protein [Bacteroidota bacterium]